MAKTALYHRTGWKPKALTVATEHEDGTVDLADDAGVVQVTGCRVVDAPENGCVTWATPELKLDEKPAPKKKPASKKAK